MSALTNFVSYLPSPSSAHPRVGHLDLKKSTIIPLSFPSGTPVQSLYEIIRAGESASFVPSSNFQEPIPLSSVTLLPPISGRDVLAVGKNYAEHAKEFNSSGFDSSDKVDQPTHPVIFTKRASSIIASGEEIYPHPGWTNTIDYEGEIGVILGKEGFKVKSADAWDYVWGFTIINDVTARERQRDHKQFFLGKSADTFCPMGPIAVPKTAIPNYKTLRVQTKVNGELRQDSDLSQLIFPIPTLIETISSGLTIQPGDVIATGTPAGVGIGKTPPVFLKPGDVITVEVPGLGTLTNAVASPEKAPLSIRHIPAERVTSPPQAGLTKLSNGKLANVERHGNASSTDVVVFVHGLGGSTSFYRSAVVAAGDVLASKNLVLYDLEGHGLSPTTPDSVVSVASYAADLQALIHTLGLSNSSISLVGHSLGCLIALTYASANPVKNIILLGAPPIPLPQAGAEASYKRADAVRANGMKDVAEAVAAAATSKRSKTENVLVAGFVRSLLLANEPEGYAKGCTAFAGTAANPVKLEGLKISGKTTLVVGDEDPVAPKARSDELQGKIGGQIQVLGGVGHWHALEDVHGVAKALQGGL